MNLIDYLNGKINYPFKKNNVALFIVNKISPLIQEAFKELTRNVYFTEYKNNMLVFIDDAVDKDLFKTLATLIDDIGEKIKIHQGIKINRNTKVSELNEYLDELLPYLEETTKVVTNFLSPIGSYQNQKYSIFIKKYLLDILHDNYELKDTISTYFKNDLNVSKTAKDLYLSRSSIFFRFDSFFNLTGIDLKNFVDCALLYILLN